jgi:hypothetical protein
MARCDVCSREMLKADSCTASHVSFDTDPKKYRRHLHDASGDEAARCHDCNVADGGYHHNGCDWERCPKCGHQFLGCDCGDNVSFYSLEDIQKEAAKS